MSGRDLNLVSVISKIGSSSATERKEGLSDVEYLFRFNRDTHTTDSFKDKTWHSVFEALFNCAAVERSAYLRSSQSQKTKATPRLAACGKALRTVVTAGVKKIRAKTVKAVVDHIIQTLPTSDGPYCPGLNQDYVKSLRIILEYQPHVEHFRDGLWPDVLDFCLEGVAPLKSGEDEEVLDGEAEPSATAGASLRTPSSMSLTRRSRGATPQARKGKLSPAFRKEVDDLVACLHQLVRATNAPLATNELNVVEAMHTFLVLADSYRLSYNEAFATINAVLARTATSSLELTRKMVMSLIPLVKDLWWAKSTSLRDEMLVTLVLTKDHVPALVGDTSEATFRVDLENLCEALQADYTKRLERDQMHMGDLVLDCTDSAYGKSNLQLPMFALQRGKFRAESLWTLIYLTASYTAALDKKKVALQGGTTNGVTNGNHTTTKRTRLTSLLYQDIIRLGSSSPTPATRVANLQYLCFMFQLRPFAVSEITDLLDPLACCTLDSNTNVGQWAILALVALAAQTSSLQPLLKSKWVAVVPQIARLITVEGCSRPAAYLIYVLLKLGIISYGDIVDIVTSIMDAPDLQGPTSTCDASLALLGWLMEARAAENPSTATLTAERMIRWMVQKWAPGSFYDKDVAAAISSSSRPIDFMQMLARCRGQAHTCTPLTRVLCGPIGRAWSKLEAASDVLAYLLLRNNDRFLTAPVLVAAEMSPTASRTVLSINLNIIDALEAETSRTLEYWDKVAGDKPQSLLPDMFTVVLGLVVVVISIVRQPDERVTRRLDSLRKKVEMLTKSVMQVLSSSDCEIERVDVALNTIADYLPILSDEIEATTFPNDLTTLCVYLTSALQRRQLNKTTANASQDEMDVDMGFESQQSEVMEAAQPESSQRDIVTLATDQLSFRRHVTAQAHLITILLKSSVNQVSPSPSITSYIMELSSQEFFASRPLFLDILTKCNVMKIEDMEELFDHLSKFLVAYDYSRHEVALLLYVDLLHSTISSWSNEKNSELRELGLQAYEWFVDTALAHEILSASAVVGLLGLFAQIFLICGPDYKPDPEAKSVRTNLFTQLRTSNIPALYSLIELLPKLFNKFTLDIHEEVLNEIHELSLYVETWLEGQALRLLLFTKLGSSWNTLVRRCIYHVFETAGEIPQTTPYARRCIEDMSRSVNLPDPKDFFRLFVGQLLYTWLRSLDGKWDNIPFAIFGYQSLSHLLTDVREEVYAQLMLRNDKKELAEVAAKIGFGQEELATYSFARTLAYSLATDADMKRKRPNESDKSEVQFRALFTDKYSPHCVVHFPKAFGILLLRTSFEKKQRTKPKAQQNARPRLPDEDSNHRSPALTDGQSADQDSEESDKELFEAMLNKRISTNKAARKDTGLESSALEAFTNMRSISSSDMRLPDPQQPVFQPRNFLDVAERLARRAKMGLAGLLQPAVYVFVLRLLLSSLHDSLGSLHACLIVRKIRILVALCGTSVLSGYPIEITLHSLRPLLTDKQCAEDTLGIFQYLHSEGIDYLKQEMRFVAGMNVTTLISLRKFVGSSQESTTQDSQHHATINRANNFRSWLVQTWSREFIEGMSDNTFIEPYKHLLSWAYGATSKANAAIDSKESPLLYQILDDRRSRRGLLSPAAWNLALELFCHDFEQPSSYREDILGLDLQARNFANEVWESCRRSAGNIQYLQWAARVLGRAGKSQDFEAVTLLHDRSNSPLETDDKRKESSVNDITHAVEQLLFSGNRNHAGVAEETIRSMLVRATKDQDTLAELHECLSATVIYGLGLMTEDMVVPLHVSETVTLESCFATEGVLGYEQWLQQLATALILFDADSPVVGVLQRILTGVSGIAEKLFAPILHLVLEETIQNPEAVRQVLSQAFNRWFANSPAGTAAHIRAMIRAILYLRKQPYPQETTQADRLKWLELDFSMAAKAAHRCGMHTAALMLAELTTFIPPEKTSRRSTTTVAPTIDDDTLLNIFRDINDPDSFYGVPQPPNLELVLNRLDHEAEGFKGLMFRGAQLDSRMRLKHTLSADDNAGLLKSLVGINMNAIAYNLMSSRNGNSEGAAIVDSVLKTAMNLEQWDVRVPDTTSSDTATLYRVFQSINNATSIDSIRKDIDAGLLATINGMLSPSVAERNFKAKVNTLGILSEVDDIVTSQSAEQLTNAWQNHQNRGSSLVRASMDEVKAILSSREITMSTLSSNPALREAMHITISDARGLQVDALLASSRIWSQRHGLQQALETVTCLSDLVPMCASVGVDVTKAAQNAVSDVLWTQGEHSTSIRMLQLLVKGRHSKHDVEDVQPASLYAKLGHHVAEARLESPNQIMSNYLANAIKELKEPTGRVAGQVHHQFATFCYDQLQNQDNTEDIERASKIKNRRQTEVDALTAQIKGMRSQTERRSRESDLSKARRWLRLDKTELERLVTVREKLMEQCLENYLLALSASDEHDHDALRFYAIWLENAQSDLANDVVNRHIGKIASYKFVRLMNQLSSRMQADSTLFQKVLCDLVYKICVEHPFHGMHYITAGTHDPGTNHEQSKLRHKAAKQISNKLKADKYDLGGLWNAVYSSDRYYHDVARYMGEEVQRQGKEVRLDKVAPAKTLLDQIPRLRTPPPTLAITVRADCQYKDVLHVVGFEPTMLVAGGLSAPKIITSRLSDGSKFKQLFKGGSDDLRQDAIMEQVFEEVSKLLAKHTTTRQRKLKIRTYNVLPLSNSTGVLEFAKNTMAMQDVCVPMHHTYHPKELKSNACRQKIGDAKGGSVDDRVKVYKDVCKNFQPAMRYFFFERNTDPDTWFERRLAYTRSTAAMSILGHVIGLGDRHLQNILLDHSTGEVVHIDLGVCFEAGKVLPMPELIPFRLTRDFVDGMGYTKTEGVYRRCCEFTLEALREERESIMTLLNVLRYDPLYSWTVSAAKAKRMQEGDDGAVNEAVEYSSKKKEDDMGEAGRALAAVEKKLGKTLSKEATVSELIAQATDEKNLALLFAGWSAWV